jgi:hypothetical protein
MWKFQQVQHISLSRGKIQVFCTFQTLHGLWKLTSEHRILERIQLLRQPTKQSEFIKSNAVTRELHVVSNYNLLKEASENSIHAFEMTTLPVSFT